MANGPQLLKDKQKKVKLPSLGKLQKEADKLMQMIGKIRYPNSLLGGQTEVMHHLVEKSVSARLRYDWDNLIPITHRQHCRIHQSGDLDLVTQIIEIRGGLGWFRKLRERGREEIEVNRAYYMGIISELKNEYEAQGQSDIS